MCFSETGHAPRLVRLRRCLWQKDTWNLFASLTVSIPLSPIGSSPPSCALAVLADDLCGLDPVNLSSSAVREGRGEETVDADSLAR